MLKKIFTILTILTFFSCGKDIVEINHTPIPNEPQEIFEVNVIGYSTDSQHNFLEEVDLTINNNLLNTDSTSFFVANEILVGKEGTVIKAEKTGFLPIFKRVYHHRSLEDVVTNITMYDSPISQEVTSDGMEIFSEDGSILSFDQGAISQSTDIVFYSSFDDENQVDMDPFIVTDGVVRMLNNRALFYTGSTFEFAEGGKVSIGFNVDKVSSIEELKIYKYDESIRTWTLVNREVKEINGKIVIDIDSFGWWALGESDETVYGTLQVNQRDVSFTGIASLKDTEVVFSKIDDRNSNEHLFTDNKGAISKYFPVALEQEISINNGSVTEQLEIGFGSEVREKILQFNEFVRYDIPAKIYDCQLNNQTGYVSIVIGNQYMVKRIENENTVFRINQDNGSVEFNFFDLNETLLSTRHIETENYTGAPVHFVACNPVFLVEKDASVLQDFDQCKVRVKPIESFIIGEDSENTFFIAFKGNGVGLYEGLVFADEVPSFSVTEIEKDVKVNIMIYDKVTSTIAGFVDGKYKNGEKYKVSFIGNVEE